MSFDRIKSLQTLYELLESNTLDDLVKTYDLIVNYHPTEQLAILHYGLIEKNKRASDVNSCRGLIIETFYPYKIISHGFDRFESKKENPATMVGIKKATIKEDGSMMFLFKHNGKFKLATMYDFATNTMAFSEKTYESLFLEIINQPLDDFANLIINQFPIDSEIMTMSFELCSAHNRVIKAYPTPKLYLTSIFGGPDGLTELEINTDIRLCQNVELIGEFVINPNRNVITIKEAYDKVDEYVTNSLNLNNYDNLTFEGIVLLTDDNRRIKIKNKYYDILHSLKYMGFLKCTPEIMVPLIAKKLDQIIIDIVVKSSPHDQLFIKSELDRRVNYYKHIIATEKEKILIAINYLKQNNVSNPKELIKYMNIYDKTLFNTWNSLFFKLVKSSFAIDICKDNMFEFECANNINKIFDENSHKLLSKTHQNKCCKFDPNFNFGEKISETNDGIGSDPYTCFCGSLMKVTELRTNLHRYKYCHCGEAYDFLTYGCWTYLMLCTNPECTCTHETHAETKTPLGIPASNFCKSLRLQIHELIANSNLSRNECYKIIQSITNKSESEAHMAKFSISDCLLVLKNFEQFQSHFLAQNS